MQSPSSTSNSSYLSSLFSFNYFNKNEQKVEEEIPLVQIEQDSIENPEQEIEETSEQIIEVANNQLEQLPEEKPVQTIDTTEQTVNEIVSIVECEQQTTNQ